MLRSWIVIAFTVGVAVAGEPKVTAPISSEDVRRICKVLAADTRDPVYSINAVYASEPVPGALPKEGTRITTDGKKSPYTSYERVDLVQASTSPAKGVPMIYTIQKLSGTWKIISKNRLVD